MQHRCVRLRELPEQWDPQNVCPCESIYFLIYGYLWKNYNVTVVSVILKTDIRVNRYFPPWGGLSPAFHFSNETLESWVVMPQIAGFHDSAHLWYLSDKSSKIHIYATWSKVLKRHRKPNLLFENSVSRCPLGKNGTKAKPLGHGKLATVLIAFSFR